MRNSNLKPRIKTIEFVKNSVTSYPVPDGFTLIYDKITKAPLFCYHDSQLVSYGTEIINKTEFYFIKYKLL